MLDAKHEDAIQILSTRIDELSKDTPFKLSVQVEAEPSDPQFKMGYLLALRYALKLIRNPPAVVKRGA